MPDNESTERSNFIRNIIEEDIRNNKNEGRIHTRFPPEPNGYLHIGHAKAVCLNFGLAKRYNGKCNLRFDDTNPVKEEEEFIRSIKKDVSWLGFDWEDRLFYASDYFGKMYEYAVELIKKGKAFVCDLTSEQIREYRGTLKEPGKESPYRNRSVEENLELFEKMKNGGFPGRFPHPPRQNRYGLSQSQYERPGNVSHSSRPSSPNRRRMVHLSHVRLGSRAGRLHRGDYPFPVFP